MVYTCTLGQKCIPTTAPISILFQPGQLQLTAAIHAWSVWGDGEQTDGVEWETSFSEVVNVNLYTGQYLRSF